MWRIYRRGGVGKVTLLSRVEENLTRAERGFIVRVLENLQPGTRIGPGQRLELGLPRIAPDPQWAQFEPLLNFSLDVARRYDSAGRP